jgi:hypothetical protein
VFVEASLVFLGKAWNVKVEGRLADITQLLKYLPGTNTLAYSCFTAGEKSRKREKKVVPTLTGSVKCFKLFLHH